MHRRTFYVAKHNVNFVTISNIIAELERDLYEHDTVDIISLFTGEVYASRNSLGLWEINV